MPPFSGSLGLILNTHMAADNCMASWGTKHLRHAYMDRHNGNKTTHTKKNMLKQKAYMLSWQWKGAITWVHPALCGVPISTPVYLACPAPMPQLDKAGTSCPRKLRVTSSSIFGVSLILQGFRGISCPISEAGCCPVFAQKPLLTDNEFIRSPWLHRLHSISLGVRV